METIRACNNSLQRLNSYTEDQEAEPISEFGSPASSPEPQNLDNLVYLKKALQATEQEKKGRLDKYSPIVSEGFRRAARSWS